MLEKSLIETTAYRSLSGAALKVYIQFRKKSFGSIYSSNKVFQHSYTALSNDTGLQRSTISSALKELQNKGFVEVVERGGLRAFNKSTNTYRLLTSFSESTNFEK